MTSLRLPLRSSPFTRSLGLSALLLSTAGCYNAEAEVTDEAKAAAEALTRSLNFTGGSLKEGKLPATDDPAVQLVPLESTVLITPGTTSVMSLTPDHQDSDVDPIVATLMQFGDASQYIEVDVEGGNDDGGTIQHHFTVAEDVCSRLCNRQFTIQVEERARTRGGKVGQTATRNVQLDCSEHGSARFCAKKASSSGGPLEERVLDKLDSCGVLEQRGKLSQIDLIPCAWECVLDAPCSNATALLCGDGEVTGDFATCVASRCASTDILFQCENGNSVDRSWQCDGEDDCGDGSDEVGCTSTEVFSCGDGDTVPISWVCDQGEDCADGSDERGCAVVSCGSDAEPTTGTDGERDAGAAGGSGSGAAGIGGAGGGAGGAGGGAAGNSGSLGPTTCTADRDCPTDSPICETSSASGVTLSFCTVACDGDSACPSLSGLPLVCDGSVCTLPADGI